MTLVELLIATGLSGVLLTALMSLTFFSARSFAAITNYVDLDNYSRNALDYMMREIRQADGLLSGDAHQLAFQYTNPTTGISSIVSYIYTPDTRTLRRVQNTPRSDTVLLRECDYLLFSLYQRNPIPGTYDQYAAASPATCKLVQMSWVCSRTILGNTANTESVQSAKVVIRKK